MTPAEVYSKYLCGRETHKIHRPLVGPGRLFGFEQLQVVKTGQLEAKTENGWQPITFTGELQWYVGRGIDLIGTFDNGLVQAVREKE